jgi:hypothetical protein
MKKTKTPAIKEVQGFEYGYPKTLPLPDDPGAGPSVALGFVLREDTVFDHLLDDLAELIVGADKSRHRKSQRTDRADVARVFLDLRDVDEVNAYDTVDKDHVGDAVSINGLHIGFLQRIGIELLTCKAKIRLSI